MNHFHFVIGIIFIAFCVEKGKLISEFQALWMLVIDYEVLENSEFIYTAATAHFSIYVLINVKQVRLYAHQTNQRLLTIYLDLNAIFFVIWVKVHLFNMKFVIKLQVFA